MGPIWDQSNACHFPCPAYKIAAVISRWYPQGSFSRQFPFPSSLLATCMQTSVTTRNHASYHETSDTMGMLIREQKCCIPNVPHMRIRFLLVNPALANPRRRQRNNNSDDEPRFGPYSSRRKQWRSCFSLCISFFSLMALNTTLRWML